MKKLKSYWLLGFGLVLFLLPLFSSDSMGQKEKCPINYPPITVPDKIQLSMNAEIECTNQLFEDLISLLQEQRDMKIEGLLPIVEKAFEKTYLKNPTLVTERESYDGWRNILPILQKKAGKIVGRRVHTLAVDAKGVFLPYDQDKKACLTDDADLRLVIESHFDLGSDDVMRGCAEHRRLCWPDDCN